MPQETLKLRVLSPSAINTYKQCPRKFFYQYILKLKTKPSIHLTRGKAVHSALENFFKIDPQVLTKEGMEFEMKTILLDFFRQEWVALKSELNSLGMEIHDQIFYYNESKKMLEVWIENFARRIKKEMEGKSLTDAFKYLTPITEKHYHSQTHSVRGFIDAIHEFEDGVHILDYKTSKKDDMSDAYRLQLAIYALLYEEEHGVKPKRVGINFLKFGEKYIEVDDLLIQEAAEAIKDIHEKTSTKEMQNYPKHITPLCKWSTGQCDFYETCIKHD